VPLDKLEDIAKQNGLTLVDTTNLKWPPNAKGKQTLGAGIAFLYNEI
jgi:hypothetical protein